MTVKKTKLSPYYQRRSSRFYKDSARGQDCQIRIPFICNRDPSTTVLAHLPNRSIGSKSPDILGAYSCSACHDMVDGRFSPGRSIGGTHYLRTDIKLMFHEGVERTIRLMIENEVIVL